MFEAVGFLDGPAGSVEGERFEEAVVRRAEHKLAPWHTGKIVKSAGRRLDVDASFVVGTTLRRVS